MTNHGRRPWQNELQLFKILLLLLVVGGAGGLLGAKIIILIYGASVQGWKAGSVLLAVSAVLAAPATFVPGLFREQRLRVGCAEHPGANHRR